jgi:hypothetical protein
MLQYSVRRIITRVHDAYFYRHKVDIGMPCLAFYGISQYMWQYATSKHGKGMVAMAAFREVLYDMTHDDKPLSNAAGTFKNTQGVAIARRESITSLF